MFGFFGKKKIDYTVKDIVWKNKEIKFQEIAKAVQIRNTQTVVVYYFSDTLEALEKTLQAAGMGYSHEMELNQKLILMDAKLLTLTIPDFSKNNIIFAEHHPSFYKEEKLLQHLSKENKNILFSFYVALDEPFMKAFGSEKIMAILNQMGYNENEAIEHSMVSSSIQKAQKKIDEKKPFTSDAHTSTDWFEINNVPL